MFLRVSLQAVLTSSAPVWGWTFADEFPSLDTPRNSLTMLTVWMTEARLREVGQPIDAGQCPGHTDRIWILLLLK